MDYSKKYCSAVVALLVAADDDIGDDLGDAMWRDWEVLNDGDDHHNIFFISH